jgi:hypothetical protein
MKIIRRRADDGHWSLREALRNQCHLLALWHSPSTYKVVIFYLYEKGIWSIFFDPFGRA